MYNESRKHGFLKTVVSWTRLRCLIQFIVSGTASSSSSGQRIHCKTSSQYRLICTWYFVIAVYIKYFKLHAQCWWIPLPRPYHDSSCTDNKLLTLITCCCKAEVIFY